MAGRVEVSQSELLNALEDAMHTPTAEEVGALSTAEISEATGRGVKWVRKRLRKLIEDGSVEVVRVSKTTISGQPTTVSAYRPVNGPETPK